MSEEYRKLWRRWRENPAGYWADAARAIDWITPWQNVLDAQAPPYYRWFPGATLNTCYNAVDRHVDRGHGKRLALIHDSAMTGIVRRFTYAELQEQVARTAGMLSGRGISRGDRVIIYMPMVPEAVIAMLACARLGAIHSVVFGGFAAHELAKRIDDAEPRLVLSASCGLEPSGVVAYKPILDAALAMSRHDVADCIVLQRPELEAALAAGRDHDWGKAVAAAPPAACVPVASTDPLYILYTSGTTGQPKGVVRDNGGHAVALTWSMSHVYGARPGAVFWAASDIGWVVGHSYIVYAPLIQGCTTVMYEGKPVGTPDAGAFWRVVRDHSVEILFTAPTAIRAIKREDPEGSFINQAGIASLRALFLAGERADPDTLAWAERHLGRPAIDHWWQTELGWPALATCYGAGDTRTRKGSAGRPVPGFDFAILGEANQPLAAGEIGDIVINLPLPPGCLPTLWNNDAGFESAYLAAHPGYYTTGDAGFIDEDGFVHVMSRIDDIINVAGHRLSTAAIEQVLTAQDDVAECAVVGVADTIKGQVPMGFIVLRRGAREDHAAIISDCINAVRAEIGPVAAFKKVAVVPRLPKTRSGKVLRGIIRKIADHESYEAPATIEDAGSLEVIEEALGTFIQTPKR